MMRYARIQDGLVVELFETDGDIGTMFHQDLVWVDVSAHAPAPQPGWRYEDGTLSPPEALPLPAMRAAALATLPAWELTERAAGIAHAGRRWLTTPDALQDIRDALLAGLVPGGVWIDAAREVVPMTLIELQALWAACVTRVAAIYPRRLVMEAEIATLDATQLAAFTQGWPT
ncbi:DUF4376 domain-containing protein [Chitiniphilus shinanonensis]|uniref:DUF4376 domain-containing protein n=1 Tax=Chitiniphilus shinanonensis TaxID=553088 RepID=UPI0033423A11